MSDRDTERELDRLRREARAGLKVCPLCGYMGTESKGEILKIIRAFVEQVGAITADNHRRMNAELLARLDEMEESL